MRFRLAIGNPVKARSQFVGGRGIEELNHAAALALADGERVGVFDCVAVAEEAIA